MKLKLWHNNTYKTKTPTYIFSKRLGGLLILLGLVLLRVFLLRLGLQREGGARGVGGRRHGQGRAAGTVGEDLGAGAVGRLAVRLKAVAVALSRVWRKVLGLG